MIFRFLTTMACGFCMAYVVMFAFVFPPRVFRCDPPGRRTVAAWQPGPCLIERGAEPEPEPAAEPCRRDRVPALAVVDVAAGVAPSGIVELVRLRRGERIAAVNDRALDEDIPAGAQLAGFAPRPGGYLDLTVSSRSTERRVLVLLH
jgi:hypothetical protein